MGAVNYAVGVAGAEYTAPNGDVYKLSGWTWEAISTHELWLERRCEDALTRMTTLTKEEKIETAKKLAIDIGANFICSFQTKLWDSSMENGHGFGHWFYVLAKPAKPKLTIQEAVTIVRDDPEGTQEAVYKANPRYRATAEPPKAEGQ